MERSCPLATTDSLRRISIQPAGCRQSQIYAFMLSEILRRSRFRSRREVRWRPHDRHAHVRPDARGDHVLGDRLAEPHSGVETFRDNVGETRFDDEFDVDVRVARQ